MSIQPGFMRLCKYLLDRTYPPAFKLVRPVSRYPHKRHCSSARAPDSHSLVSSYQLNYILRFRASRNPLWSCVTYGAAVLPCAKVRSYLYLGRVRLTDRERCLAIELKQSFVVGFAMGDRSWRHAQDELSGHEH